MNSTNSHRSTSPTKFSKLAVAAGLIVGAGLLAAPAYAHGPHLGVAVNFPVPSFIAPWDAVRLAPYVAARVAVGPRLHVVYRFPVETPYGLVYRPYAYCDGRLVGLAVGPVYGGRWEDRRFDRPWRHERDERHERWERDRDRRCDRDRDRWRDERDGRRDRWDRD